MSLVGTHSVVWVKHDTNENDVPAIGFIGHDPGTLIVKLRKDTATRTITVQNGRWYPLDLKLIATGGTGAPPTIVYGSERTG
jgi:hypothetical protein